MVKIGLQAANRLKPLLSFRSIHGCMAGYACGGQRGSPKTDKAIACLKGIFPQLFHAGAIRARTKIDCQALFSAGNRSGVSLLGGSTHKGKLRASASMQ